MSNKQQVVTKTTKNFSYTKDEVSINFNVNVDTSAQLKMLLDCLLQAVEEIGEEIELVNIKK